MKLQISPKQLDLLASRFIIVEGGLLSNDNNLITESMKEFKVKVFFGGWQSEIIIGANSSGSALAIVKLMFPKAILSGMVKQV